MQVILKRNWFAPNAVMYPKSATERGTEVPDTFAHRLPRDAVIVGRSSEPEAPVNSEAPVETLGDHDIERASADALAEVQGGTENEEAARLARAEEFRRQVAASMTGASRDATLVKRGPGRPRKEK